MNGKIPGQVAQPGEKRHRIVLSRPVDHLDVRLDHLVVLRQIDPQGLGVGNDLLGGGLLVLPTKFDPWHRVRTLVIKSDFNFSAGALQAVQRGNFRLLEEVGGVVVNPQLLISLGLKRGLQRTDDIAKRCGPGGSSQGGQKSTRAQSGE